MDWVFIFFYSAFLPYLVYTETRVVASDSKIFHFTHKANLSHVGYQLRNHVIQDFSTKYQVTQCAMECLVAQRCKSFNFGRLTHVCQLNDATHEEYPSDFDAITDADITEYHQRDAFSIDEEALGPCHSFPCQNNGRCLDSKSALTGNRIHICICTDGWTGDNCDIEENRLEWASWEEWTACSVSCGNGYQSRRRDCEDTKTSTTLPATKCFGRDVEYRACTFKPCPKWDSWGSWSECSTFTTCGRGYRVRERQCAHGGTPGVDRYCLGPTNETSVCHGIKCNSLVRLRDGSEYGEGRVEMYHDQSSSWLQVCADNVWNTSVADIACRQRGFLEVDAAIIDGSYGENIDLETVELKCQGNEWTLQQCERTNKTDCVNKAAVQCKVRGAWSLWTSWSECSVTCENGIETRTRSCNHPPPNFNGLKCPGVDTEHRNCTKIMCPDDGIWQPWTSWSLCSVTCANGTQTRTRSCIGPFHKGKDCEGDSLEVKECFPKMCPVDGEWKTWEIWSACSASCGYGNRGRSRMCIGPYYDGAPCDGPTSETEVCNAFSCPVDGSWKQWSDWGSCNVSCGGGMQERYRECNNPLHGGADCPGPSNQTQACNTHKCPVDGVWMIWTGWTDCSVTCANGTRSRNRTCIGPFHGGQDCVGEPFEEEICSTLSCPVDGVWNSWSSWDACNVTCGGGGQWRYRTCDGPFFLGKDCVGNREELQECNMTPCPVDGEWTIWTKWTTCTLTCGKGIQTRNRTCIGTAHDGKECEGDADQVQDCNTDPCPVDGSWKHWSSWTSCNVTCGGGHTWRTRECNLPAHGGKTCDGPALEALECNTHHCPVDGYWEMWSNWTSCSLTCGNGTQSRNRTCIGPFYNGSDCEGDDLEERSCNTFFCPIDGQWEEWSNWTECSQSCGWGTQSRYRDCDGPYYGGANCQGETTETQDCNPSNCPVDGIWSLWSEWSPCDVTCSDGTRSRQRLCNGPFNGGQNCTGEDFQTETCNPRECPVDGIFMEWSMWTECPVSCGGAERSRERKCMGPFFGGHPCQGLPYEEEDCNIIPCPVDGEWSFWSSWSQCNVTCGGGYTHRFRYCTEAAHGGSNCPGDSDEYEVCNTHNCPINGVFDTWSSWSECSVSCGGGHTSRNRTCDGPYFGGLDCSGKWDQVQDCNTHECPIDGVFDNWSEWFDCSTTCGGGIRNRTRDCIGPFYDGAPCVGDFNQLEDCNTHECPIDGVFDEWSSWVDCSVTCGGGSQWRERVCIGPFYGGQSCDGPYNTSQACNTHNCPVDGVWMTWSSWGICDVTCAGGTQMRNRSCDGPYYNGNDCIGVGEEIQACNTHECPVDGQWVTWSAWESCSVSCGGGEQSRNRTCDGPYYGGANCSGPDYDTQACNMHNCPVDGVLSIWTAWYECDVTCGGGIQWRNRSCNGPFYNGKPCEGELEESQMCNIQPCPIDGEWDIWTTWGQCNVTCGGGTQIRFRTCDGPYHGGADCQGPMDDIQDCNTHPCPIDGIWKDWTDWASCDKTCGGGIQWRERSCDGPYYDGANCTGSSVESQDCNQHPCPVDGQFTEWGMWGSCDVTCGGGTQMRNRTCYGPFHNGMDCQGDLNENQDCNTQNCPVDGDWQEWSTWGDCSVTCGGGKALRNRTCYGPFYKGADCVGSEMDEKNCSTNPCPIPGDWLEWGGWSRCSKTCGTGTRTRERVCDMNSKGNLTAPCEGGKTGIEDCHTYPCQPYAQTCSELVKWGLLDSANVTLQPTPDHNPLMLELEPCEVYCDLESENGIGVTVIDHDKEARTYVSGYEGPGDYKVQLTYSITKDHVESIIEHSAKCKQYLKWECYAATIKNPHNSGVWSTFWMKRGNIPADYFPGGVPGSGKCGCGQIGSCANVSAACNCDSNDKEWREDGGYLTYKDDLPIYSFNAGDTGDAPDEAGYHTIGPLECFG